MDLCRHWERRAGLDHLLSSKGSSESQWTGPRCPSVHLLLRFAHLHERLATHASLFKFLRSPAGKASIELCGQTRGSWNSFYTAPGTPISVPQWFTLYKHEFGWSWASHGGLDQMPSHTDSSRFGREDRAGILAEPLASPLLLVFWPWSPLLENLH